MMLLLLGCALTTAASETLRPPPPTQQGCAAAASCHSCVARGCGWCGSSERCGLDHAGSCEAEELHVGFAEGVHAGPLEWLCPDAAPSDGGQGGSGAMAAAGECLAMARLGGLHRPLAVAAARVEASGWLSLFKAGKTKRGWLKRWCVLEPGGALACARTPTAPLRPFIRLGDCSSLAPSREPGAREQELALSCGSGVKRLHGLSTDSQRRWVRAIITYLTSVRCQAALDHPALQPSASAAGAEEEAAAAHARLGATGVVAVGLTRLGHLEEAGGAWAALGAALPHSAAVLAAAGWAMAQAATAPVLTPRDSAPTGAGASLTTNHSQLSDAVALLARAAELSPIPSQQQMLRLEIGKLALLLDEPEPEAAARGWFEAARAVASEPCVDCETYMRHLSGQQQWDERKPAAEDAKAAARADYSGFRIPKAKDGEEGGEGWGVGRLTGAELASGRFEGYYKRREPVLLDPAAVATDAAGAGEAAADADAAGPGEAAAAGELRWEAFGEGWRRGVTVLRNTSQLLQAAGDALVGVESTLLADEAGQATSTTEGRAAAPGADPRPTQAAPRFGPSVRSVHGRVPLAQALRLLLQQGGGAAAGWRHYINLDPSAPPPPGPGPGSGSGPLRRGSPLDRAPMAAMAAPPFLPRGALVLEQNLWLGAAEGTSALHADPFDNVLVVVRGEYIDM